MGWWNALPDGSSLQVEVTGLAWGDGPADVVDTAIDAINAEFKEGLGRRATAAELRAGLEFSLGIYEDQASPSADHAANNARILKGDPSR